MNIYISQNAKREHLGQTWRGHQQKYREIAEDCFDGVEINQAYLLLNI